jgi:aspartyl-tRNA(Asn)/glutamyl-tRNA(Gln) amidotransferase subunit A
VLTHSLAGATITDLSTAIVQRDASPVEIVDAYLTRIGALDGTLRCFITVLSDSALDAARRAEEDITRGRHRGRLHGIPVAIKDIFQTAGVRTTCGSKVLADWIPTQDAAVVQRLAAAGTILLGKLNMHEFAFRVPAPAYPTPRNPWNLERSCAGSSSGSAAALAAGLCPGSLGTDTGGSIRGPAAFCGIVGHKPTYGLVSRAGVVPLAWTLDHVGPMARTVEDCALLLDAIAGYDPADPGSAQPTTGSFHGGLQRSLRGVRLGLVRVPYEKALPPDAAVAREVEAAVRAAAQVLHDAGMTIDEVDLPRVDDALAAYRTIVFSEAAAYHQAHFPARAADYGPRLREQLALGLAIPAAQYIQAQRMRRIVIGEMGELLRRVDLLLLPASLTDATPIDREPPRPGEGFTPAQWLTNIFNIIGAPALALPCGFSTAGLSLGMQLVGRPFEDALVLAAGHAYQQVTDWHRRTPDLTSVAGGAT